MPNVERLTVEHEKRAWLRERERHTVLLAQENADLRAHVETLTHALAVRLDNDAMERLYQCAHNGRTGCYTAMRELLLAALQPPDAPKELTTMTNDIRIEIVLETRTANMRGELVGSVLNPEAPHWLELLDKLRHLGFRVIPLETSARADQSDAPKEEPRP